MEDAERAVVIIGSAAGTTKDAVDRLREQGEKVGLLKIRLYRPFPAEAIAEALKEVEEEEKRENQENTAVPEQTQNTVAEETTK